MAETKRNNLDIYDEVAGQWWSGDVRWVRTLKNLVPGRLKWFDRYITGRDWKFLIWVVQAASWQKR